MKRTRNGGGREVTRGFPQYSVADSVGRNRHANAWRGDRSQTRRNRSRIELRAGYLIGLNDILVPLDINISRSQMAPQREIEHAADHSATENRATVGVRRIEFPHRIPIYQIELAVFIAAYNAMSTRYQGRTRG